MPLDQRQEQELVGGGDTLLHYHLQDRATNASMQEQERVTHVSADYNATYADDVLLVTATSTVLIVLPIARSRRLTIVRIGGVANINVVRQGTDTINGATSVIVATSYAPLRLKAISGLGYVST